MWKNIKGYEGLYQVSDEGEVRSLGNNESRKEKILKPAYRGNGYLFVSLCKNGKKKMFSIHRLVAEAFLPNSNNLPEINHKDENKANNCASNLEWCDRKYNVNYGTGKKRSAEKRTNNEKTSKSVKQFDLQGNYIREFPSISEVQRRLGYSFQNISSACLGKYNQAYGYRWSYN